MPTDFGAAIAALLGNNVVLITIFTLVVLAFVNFGTGVVRAWQDGLLKWELIDSWARTTGGKVTNILFILVASLFCPQVVIPGVQLEVNPLAAIGLGFAGTMIVALLASIKNNVDKQVADKLPTQ